MRYTEVHLNVSEGQKDKIKQAFQAGGSASIKLTYEDLRGNDTLSLTNAQIRALAKAFQDQKGITLKLSKAQIKAQMTVQGGFLPALLGMLPMIGKIVGPALLAGAVSGAASAASNKATKKVIGKGVCNRPDECLFLKRANAVAQVSKSPDGAGLYLHPPTGGHIENLPKGNGLYLGNERFEKVGRGLLLGSDSPFKNIPLLGALL